MKPEITAHYVNSDSMGYGRMALRIVDALGRAGVDVVKGEQERKTNTAFWMSTPAHARRWFRGQHISILTMHESQRLPEGMIEGLHNFDVVLVPSQHNVDLFSRHHDNVRLCLLGVDPQWSFTPRQEPDVFFDFLIGGSGERKGCDLAFAAFQKVFGDWDARNDGPIPRLIMKNPRREGYVGDRVEMVGGKISSEEEVALYARAHCYLQPSRGEGFGMQPLQAIAQGLPTILTGAHGHASFAHLGYGIPAASSPAGYFSSGPAGDWWEPDFDALCERMKWVYENYDQARDFARRSAEVAAVEFTWDRTARSIIDAHDGLLTVPYTGDGTFVEADLKRFKIIVNDHWRADIAGRSYYFEPGVPYWESADVLRILFDAGKLDPACLDEEGGKGLTEAQLAHLGSYSASHSHCPTCQQRLNTGPTRGDDLMKDGEIARLKAEVERLTALLEPRAEPVGA